MLNFVLMHSAFWHGVAASTCVCSDLYVQYAQHSKWSYMQLEPVDNHPTRKEGRKSLKDKIQTGTLHVLIIILINFKL